MDRYELMDEIKAGDLYPTGGCESGTEDKFSDVLDVFKWDYYNNGENPNLSKYKNIFYNTTVFVAENTTNPSDCIVFKGDMGRERLIFLMYLSMKDDVGFVVQMEQKVIQYLLKDGMVYSRDTRETELWELNNKVRNLILHKERI